MFPFLLALLFILKIRLGVQSNIKKSSRNATAGRARNYSEHMKLMMPIVSAKLSIKYSC